MNTDQKTNKALIHSGEVLYLPCSKLVDHPMHFQYFSQTHLVELGSSIKEAGLLEPIVVYPLDNEKYRIISGHYRIRAIRRLRWKQVLCRVINCDHRLAAVLYCTSNLLARSLSVMEEAYLISRLVEEEKFTLTEIGAMWGRSKSWVSRRLKLLLHLDPKLKRKMEMGYLSPRMAQEILRLPQGNDQERALEVIKKNRMNKDQAAEFISWWLKATEQEKKQVETQGLSPPVSLSPAGQVAAQLTTCTKTLDQIIHLVEKGNVISWWPGVEYDSFKVTVSHLDQVLTKQVLGGKHNAPDL